MSVSVQDPVDTVDRGDLLHSSHSCAGFSLQRVSLLTAHGSWTDMSIGNRIQLGLIEYCRCVKRISLSMRRIIFTVKVFSANVVKCLEMPLNENELVLA